MNKKRIGIILVCIVLFVGIWSLSHVFTSAAFRILSPRGWKPKTLSLGQYAPVRLIGKLEENPQTIVSPYRLVGSDWSIGLDVAKIPKGTVLGALDRFVMVSGMQTRVLFGRRSSLRGSDNNSSSPVEIDIVRVSTLMY